jgi:hypothetical protein
LEASGGRRADYFPVSVAELANAGLSVLGQPTTAATGKHLLRGLPFDIANDSDRCFVVLGRGFANRVSIQINRSVRSIVFAHRLLESPILEGGPVGIPVAELAFDHADGSEDVRTLRDRFEIATLPVRWGQVPFAAFPDRFDRLPPRYRGRFEDAGVRQTEAGQAWARNYWLWAWINPKPNMEVTQVRVNALGPSFLIAGLCVGTVVEHPLRLPAAQTVVIDIDAAALVGGTGELLAAEEPLDFDDHVVVPRSLVDFAIEVDRGVASFPYTLAADADTLMQDVLRGFGRPLNPNATPAYANVAATTSSTLSVSRGNRMLGAVKWSDLINGDSALAGPLRIRLADSGRNWVRTKFVDGDTGEPLACRVHFSSTDGVPYAPHGHHSHVGSDLGTWHRDVGGDVRLGQATYAYVDGSCEGWLPRGEVVIDAARGFEYEPLRTVVTIEPAQQDLTIALKRVRNLRREGWYSGDTHVHFLSTLGAHLEARGEDLSVVNLLTSQWGHLFTSTEEFTGRPSVSNDKQTIVYASQENRQHVLGHLTLLGLKHPVMPWCTDGAEEAELGGALEATMSEWADRCHEQGGLVILPHMPNPNGEPAALIASGRADAVEFLEPTQYNHLEYYRYLNGGYRLPLVGGTDKMSSDVPVGLCRTFVNIPAEEEFTYETWCTNLARGRTFVSTGPLISLKVDGASPGDTLRVQPGATVEVVVDAYSIFPIHSIELIQQGVVVESSQAAAGSRQLTLRASIRISSDSWIAARVGGPDYFRFVTHRDLWSRGVMAHTSPIYVSCGERYQVFSSATAEYMLTLIEGSLTYIQGLSPQYPEGRATHHHGESDHIAHLSRPFVEARDLLLRLSSSNDDR